MFDRFYVRWFAFWFHAYLRYMVWYQNRVLIILSFVWYAKHFALLKNPSIFKINACLEILNLLSFSSIVWWVFAKVSYCKHRLSTPHFLFHFFIFFFLFLFIYFFMAPHFFFIFCQNFFFFSFFDHNETILYFVNRNTWFIFYCTYCFGVCIRKQGIQAALLTIDNFIFCQ